MASFCCCFLQGKYHHAQERKGGTKQKTNKGISLAGLIIPSPCEINRMLLQSCPPRKESGALTDTELPKSALSSYISLIDVQKQNRHPLSFENLD